MDALVQKQCQLLTKTIFLNGGAKVASHPYGGNSSQIQSDKGRLRNIVEQIQVKPGNDYRKKKKVSKLRKVSK